MLGPDYIIELFRIVDAYAPDSVELVLNDNFVEYFPAKAEGLVNLVRDLVEAGAPIDAVGFQTHLMLTEILNREPDFELLQATMERVADLGVNVFAVRDALLQGRPGTSRRSLPGGSGTKAALPSG